MKRIAWLLPLAALLSSACATRYLGNTRIEDTKENRELVLVVEHYRRAVEDRDVRRILDLTSDRFFEDPGTPYDPTDDYDKAELAQRLEEAFSKVKDQRLVVDVRKAEIDKRQGKAHVDYRFDFRYRLDLPDANQWREQTDLNRLNFVRENGEWKIVSGL